MKRRTTLYSSIVNSITEQSKRAIVITTLMYASSYTHRVLEIKQAQAARAGALPPVCRVNPQ